MKIRKLSIIVPVFNEEKSVAEVIKRLRNLEIKGLKKEIIVVDDGSTDTSVSTITKLQAPITKFKFIKHKYNIGKGAAIKTGLKYATGDYVIIQDADLEYHPQEMKKLVRMAVQSNCPVVFGTRNKGVRNEYAYPVMYWGAKILIWMINILYRQKLSDPECCYKLIKRKLLDFDITEKGFGVEIELVAKLAQKGIKIAEAPIKYTPRTYEEGKKITIGDGIRAIWLAVKWAV
jgi:glycosyltransferase involved in cell wall biosynthesis